MGPLPALVTAAWCPFTLTAENFWRDAARATGVTMRVVNADTEEGRRIIAAADVAGVPCAINPAGAKRYGLQLTPEEAARFLTGGKD